MRLPIDHEIDCCRHHRLKPSVPLRLMQWCNRLQFLGRATRFMFLCTQIPWASASTPLSGSAICQSKFRINYNGQYNEPIPSLIATAYLDQSFMKLHIGDMLAETLEAASPEDGICHSRVSLPSLLVGFDPPVWPVDV